MIQPVLTREGNIHVRLCQQKTVYMIPPVLSRADIIYVKLCQPKLSI